MKNKKQNKAKQQNPSYGTYPDWLQGKQVTGLFHPAKMSMLILRGVSKSEKTAHKVPYIEKRNKAPPQYMGEMQRDCRNHASKASTIHKMRGLAIQTSTAGSHNNLKTQTQKTTPETNYSQLQTEKLQQNDKSKRRQRTELPEYLRGSGTAAPCNFRPRK